MQSERAQWCFRFLDSLYTVCKREREKVRDGGVGGKCAANSLSSGLCCVNV